MTLNKRIKTFNNIAKAGLDRLKNRGYQINPKEDPEGIILRSYQLKEEDVAESVLGIARAGVGVNNIPIDFCSDQGIVVFNTPGANAESVKEVVIAMMINSARNVIPASQWTQELSGPDAETAMENGKKNFLGNEINGKVLGVIGLGHVGARVANTGIDLGMHVLGYDPYMSVHGAWQMHQQVEKVEDVREIFRRADFISLHTPLTEQTKQLVDEEKLAIAKDGVVILNYSRKELIDVEAMLTFLQNDKVKLYVTDFYTEALAQRDDVIMTPHIGGTTTQAEEKCALMASDELMRYLETGEIVNAVNFPNIEATFNAPLRLSIINRNIPNMVAHISTELAEKNINIDKIINKSRGNYAYTLVDISGDIERVYEVIDKLNSVDGILKCRIISNKKIV